MNNFLWFLLAIFALALSWLAQSTALAWAACLFALVLFFSWAMVALMPKPAATRLLSSAHVHIGEEIKVRIRLKSPRRLWGWMLVNEASSPLSMKGKRGLVLGPGGASESEIGYSLQATRRGYFAIGPLTTRYGDSFGFAEGSVDTLEAEHITVFPRIIPMGKMRPPTARSPGELRTMRRTFEDPARPSGIRSYMQGDALRRIHWKATARTGHPQSKLYDVCTSLQAFMLLNLRRQDYSPSPLEADQAVELAICLAASLSVHLLDAGQRVGLLTNALDLERRDEYLKEAGVELLPESLSRLSDELAARNLVFLPPDRSPDRALQLLSLLARLQPASGQQLPALLQRVRQQLNWGETIVVITPSVSPKSLDSLAALVHAGLSVLVVVVGDSPLSTQAYLRLISAAVPCVRVATEEEISGLFA